MNEHKNMQLYMLQVNDSLFPIGGYSHSQGLETYIQKGLVYDSKTAEKYLHYKLKWSLKYTEVLSVRLAYLSAQKGSTEELSRLEDIIEASRIPMEQREAARKMGSRFVKTVIGLGIKSLDKENGIFKQYLKSRAGKTVSHSCAYGVFCAVLGLDLEEVLLHYLYGQTSAMVTNCVKTIPLSQSTGQQLLSGCFEEIKAILEEIKTCKAEDLCLGTPGFDIRGIQHERLYSRLYMS